MANGIVYNWSPLGGSGSGVATYANFAAFPASAANGTLALALDTDILYAYNTGSASWVIIGGPGAALSIGTIDSTTASANGAVILADALIMQSASATRPGLVNITTQTFAGNKTFSGTIGASNLSGTNTGDVTLAAVGSSGNVNGASLSSQALTLQPASASFPGVLTAADWTTFNSKQSTVTIGALDAQAANATGLALVASVLSTQSADATHPGLVNVTAQTFAGDKTFNGVVSAPGGSAPAVGLHLGTDVGTGFYRPGVDQLNIAAAGSLVANIGTSGIAVTGALSASTTVTATTQLISSVSTGTAPLVVSSTTQVANLNAATAGSATTATTATNANNVATTQVSNSASYFPLMVSSSTNGNQACDLGTGLTFNPSTNVLATTTFSGALSGNATTSTTATNATNVATTATNSTNASFFPTFVAAGTSGNQGVDTATGLTFNPSTNTLTTTTFSGALTGTASGNFQGTPSNHGMLISGSGNTVTVLAPDSSTTKVWTSGGSSADPSWQVIPGGAPKFNYTAQTTTYSAVIGDYVTCTSGTFDVTLPTAASVSGQSITVLNIGTGIITLKTTSSQTIGGYASAALTLAASQNELITVTSDGANWQISAHTYKTTWVSWTPTFVGVGTVASVNCFWKRNGANMDVKIKFTTGTGTAVVFTATLPIGSIDATANVGTQVVGTGTQDTTGSFGAPLYLLGTASGTVFNCSLSGDGSSSSLTAAVANHIFNNSDAVSFYGSVPITGWW